MNSIRFWSELSLVMKNGLLTITSVENDHGPSTMKRHKPLQRLIFMKRRLCCQLGGIGRVWYISSCCQGTKRLIRMSTVNNWTNGIQSSTRSDHNWSIVKVSYFIRTTLDRIYLWSFAKYWESLVGIFWPCTVRLPFVSVFAELLNGKTFDNYEAIKSHFVQFIAEKSQKFYERGIINFPKRWQKVIEQNEKYIIE